MNKKVLFLLLGIIAVVIGAYACTDNEDEKGIDKVYLLPDGFNKESVVVNFNVDGAPPLEVKENKIVYTIPESGVLTTSSDSSIQERHSRANR
ncbi:DUF6843 domain-containing protein [Domibacillus indicus]|uniref:DUF6843 domain-containing protein n=1 Tax=Domibacillus indicus TaxID=1437523 RepID=UPI000618345A|nr:hypothetical protein [Domibacillus indicus]